MTRYWILLSLLAGAAQAADLTVTIDHLKANGGKVYIALYSDAAAFPKTGQQFRAEVVESHGERAMAEFHDLAPGRYAIAVFEDLNGNGVLDKGFMGKPKEPYGFSQNASGHMGPPSFDAAAFTVSGSPVALQIDAH